MRVNCLCSNTNCDKAFLIKFMLIESILSLKTKFLKLIFYQSDTSFIASEAFFFEILKF